jgi:hypothetical protein
LVRSEIEVYGNAHAAEQRISAWALDRMMAQAGHNVEQTSTIYVRCCTAQRQRHAE